MRTCFPPIFFLQDAKSFYGRLATPPRLKKFLQYDSVQLEIAVYMLNKRGAEGQTSHGENGISRTWGGADVPEELLASITPYARVHG